MQRIEKDKVDAMVEASKEEAAQAAAKHQKGPWPMTPLPTKLTLMTLLRSICGSHKL